MLCLLAVLFLEVWVSQLLHAHVQASCVVVVRQPAVQQSCCSICAALRASFLQPLPIGSASLGTLHLPTFRSRPFEAGVCIVPSRIN